MPTTTEAKERPIIFTAESVRAILEGRKTKTRRVIDPQPEYWPEKISGTVWPSTRGLWRDCPYGLPGDRLWVREMHQPLFADGVKRADTDWKTGKGYAIRYIATDGRTEWMDADDNLTDRCKPGIHMPRWASRLSIEITDVLVERVQDISEADIVAEGIAKVEGMDGANWSPGTFGYSGMGRGTYHIRKPKYERYCHCIEGKKHQLQPPQCAYRELWNSINAKRGYGWEKKPWVWVLTFKKLEPTT